MIIKFIVNNPLNPSIKFAPLITKRKQSNTNIEEKIWLDIKEVSNGISIFKILIGKKFIKIKRRSIIIINLLNGFIFIFKSSKKPTKNTE